MATAYDVPPFLAVAANATVVEHDGDATLAATDAGKIHTNTGVDALETIALTLPTAATLKGEAIKVYLTAAEIVQLVPQTGESIYLGGSGVASKYLQIAGVIGNYADVYCDGSQYLVTDYSGVLTKEA